MENKKSLLLVDDDADIREIFAIFLEENYPTLHLEETGIPTEVPDLIKKNRFDLLVSDLKMPVLNGNELVKLIEKDPNCPPNILILTGFLEEIDTSNLKVKNLSYMTKPFKENVLKAYFRRHLGVLDKGISDNQNKSKKLEEEKSQLESRNSQLKEAVEFIEPFIDSTILIVEKVLNEKPISKKVIIKKPNEKDFGKSNANISTLCEIISPNIIGHFGFHFEKNSFLSLYNHFHHQNERDINRENCLFIGQLADKILDHSKKILKKAGVELEFSRPRGIFLGNNLSIYYPILAPTLLAEFQLQSGSFFLEILFKKKKN